MVSFSTEVYFTGSTAEIRTALNWLEADLTKANKNRDQRPWIIFLTHHPIYCSVESADCTTKASIIRDGVMDANNKTWGGLEDILLKHKVDIYMRYVRINHNIVVSLIIEIIVVMYIIMNEHTLFQKISALLPLTIMLPVSFK